MTKRLANFLVRLRRRISRDDGAGGVDSRLALPVGLVRRAPCERCARGPGLGRLAVRRVRRGEILRPRQEPCLDPHQAARIVRDELAWTDSAEGDDHLQPGTDRLVEQDRGRAIDFGERDHPAARRRDARRVFDAA